ncbi:MAG: hypothetical protein OEO20_15535 [Gemmatimonadota bacterium]|nr:hypothetical protein [Gemmatimonadota bacterium]MDH3479708.1 hypothetical protein [Gemmatimonadota bacterium]MDH3570235.1 hypothetical protein [Gemmatimonadota bacterium]
MNSPSLPLARTVAALAAIAVASAVLPQTPAGLGTQSLTAQEPAPSPSAALLRRLAASADAFRNGQPVFVVASEVYPHDVIDVYADREAAFRAADSAGIDFHLYGPFVTPQDAGLPLIVLGCYKDDITTRYVCPPIMGGGQDPVFRMEEVDSLRITFFSNLRGPISIGMVRPPSSMIFTLDAFDRFIAPYYLHLFGPEYVVQMREQMMEYVRRGLGIR